MKRFRLVKGVSSEMPEADKRHTTQTLEPLGIEHYGEIEELLGYTFVDRSWLERALTHRSMQAKGAKSDYERLEFLGDAVFDLAVAHLLLDRHPDAKEGDLSKMRAALVNTTSLAEIARGLQLGKFIRLSRGELASGGSERASILADVVEAVVGAVYREGQYEAAMNCVERLLGEQLTSVTPRDPKTELQEALHASGSEAPVYRLECVEGPEHAPVFISVVEVDGQIVGRGKGPTKKASQQSAAEEALAHLKGGDEIDRVFEPVATAQSACVVSVTEGDQTSEGE
jgi:ribonuclease-3